MSVANDLRADTQFSVFLVNKPGVLAAVVQRLADAKVNIVAISMMDSTEHGVLRAVVERPEQARTALRGMDLNVVETQVLTAAMPNRTGALADVVERLASAHVAVNYAYCTTGSRNGKTLGIFKVSNLNKAVDVLSGRKPKRKTAKAPRGAGRRAEASRRAHSRAAAVR